MDTGQLWNEMMETVTIMITIYNNFSSSSSFVDIDECQDDPCTGEGEQGCVNTIGGYYCTCDVQHLLVNGQCQGKFRGQKSEVIRYNLQHIRLVD